MSKILHRLGYVRKGHVVTATRDDLVGQYIGHTAPKTREMLKKAMGGVLFIDEAYYLYRPENERDYGAEAIEILLQVMEANREDLVVIFAGYKDRMDVFYQSNPGLSSRVANHIDFPDYSASELLAIAKLILAAENYRLSEEATVVFAESALNSRVKLCCCEYFAATISCCGGDHRFSAAIVTSPRVPAPMITTVSSDCTSADNAACRPHAVGSIMTAAASLSSSGTSCN